MSSRFLPVLFPFCLFLACRAEEQGLSEVFPAERAGPAAEPPYRVRGLPPGEGVDLAHGPAERREAPIRTGPPAGLVSGEASASFRWRPLVDRQGGVDGRMGRSTSGGEAGLRRFGADSLTALRVEYSRHEFDFRGVSDPWGSTDWSQVGGYLETAVSGPWGVFANGGARFGFEEGAGAQDSFTALLSAGARYRFSPSLNGYLGVMTLTRLDQNALVVPIFSFNYRAGRWSVTTMNGVLLGYDCFGDGSLLLEASLLYDNQDFRLSPEVSTGRRRMVQFQELPLAFSLTSRLVGPLFVRFHAAAILWGDYRVRLEGLTVEDFQTGPAASFGFSFGARF